MLVALATMVASAGMAVSPFLASCAAAAKANAIVCGTSVATLTTLGVRWGWARDALRPLALGLCLSALLLPPALAPWSYRLFAIAIFATAFARG